MVKNFFLHREEHSKIKSEIVTKYFCSWASVMIGHQKKFLPKGPNKIAFIDLFSGPGRFDDGSPSTPLLILHEILKDSERKNWITTLFNDKEKKFCESLKKEISNLPGINSLKFEPIIWNKTIDDRFIDLLEESEIVPTLCFADPWGYKGLSLRLFYSVLKNWGCDLLVFFNYNRINMSISNKLFLKYMDDLFGHKRANELRGKLKLINKPLKRQEIIINSFATALQEYGKGKYFHKFSFKKSDGSRISHHLIFASKNIKGLTIFKNITQKYSSRHDQGVPSFEYNPSNNQYAQLIEASHPLDDLCEILLNEFAGQTITMKEIFEKHHVGKDYIEKNYKDALLKLEEQDKIKTNPPAEKRKKRQDKLTFGPYVKVFFPIKVI